jgi:hypothetical protein
MRRRAGMGAGSDRETGSACIHKLQPRHVADQKHEKYKIKSNKAIERTN